ncbi:chain length determinant protein tyrosine kinase EpsG [Chitinibacteraceae bacterium HSL-7]
MTANDLPVVSQSTANSNIGKLLLESGKINPQQAEKVLLLQREEGLRFGEAAIRLGYISDDDIRYALSHQFEYAYLKKGEGGLSDELLAAYNPFDKRVEALRSLRGQLMLRWVAGGNKSVLFAGYDHGSGASATVANLAVVFSQLGERTLVVDANLRAPHQHQLFGLSNRAGLSDVLANRAGFEAIQRVGALRDLSVLTAGNPAPNPQELLARDTFGALLASLEQRFDVILFDGHPFKDAADAQLLAARIRGTVLVAAQHVTPLAGLQHAQAQLKTAGAELLGCVLNARR